MKIDQHIEGDKLYIALDGDLNTLTAPELEAALQPHLDKVSQIEIDMAHLSYLTSAGLRVLLVAYTAMSEKGGSLIVKNPNDEIREIFDVTSFSSFLTIQ